MATKKFQREPKEYTTEPSDDEVGNGMKRGGHAHKKHMAMGGNPMMGMPMRPRARMAMSPSMPTQQPALLRKKGGEVESKKEHKSEMHEMRKIEKELKHHEHMKAGKAHHGLKKGGKASFAKDNTPGGLLGGIEATRPDHKNRTGDIELTGYKHGGKMHHAHGGKVHRVSGHPEGSHEHHKHMAKHHAKMYKEGGSAHHKKMMEHHKACCTGGAMKHGGKMMHKATGGLANKGDAFQARSAMKPKIDVQDHVYDASHNKKAGKSTGKVKDTVAGQGAGGYKRGGHAKHHYAKGGTVSQNVANRYVSDMQDGEHRAVSKKTSGNLELSKFKKGGHVKHHAHGGHVAHHTTHGHEDAGHTHMHKHSAKHAHGHDKIDGHPMKKGGHVKHHMRKGGKCNY